MALGWLLFANGHRHMTAEALYEEALQLKTSVSLATVYNTLRQSTRAGLLKEIPIEGARNALTPTQTRTTISLSRARASSWISPTLAFPSTAFWRPPKATKSSVLMLSSS
jgi:Ferric uptake regulator family